MADVTAPGSPVVVTVPQTGSTQDDLRALAADAAGWPHLSGLRALRQTAGRGRGDRRWDTDDVIALTASLVLRPSIPVPDWPWLPLLTGCAVTDALAEAGLPAALKWPNDVVLPAAEEAEGWGRWRKVAGVLAEVLPQRAGVLVGIGVNLGGTPPVPWATTLAEHGLQADADTLLAAIRTHLTQHLASERTSWPAAVEHRCASIGAQVVAHLPGGDQVAGTARAIDPSGGLVIVQSDGSERVIVAGDVEHLRAAPDRER